MSGEKELVDMISEMIRDSILNGARAKIERKNYWMDSVREFRNGEVLLMDGRIARVLNSGVFNVNDQVGIVQTYGGELFAHHPGPTYGRPKKSTPSNNGIYQYGGWCKPSANKWLYLIDEFSSTGNPELVVGEGLFSWRLDLESLTWERVVGFKPFHNGLQNWWGNSAAFSFSSTMPGVKTANYTIDSQGRATEVWNEYWFQEYDTLFLGQTTENDGGGGPYDLYGSAWVLGGTTSANFNAQSHNISSDENDLLFLFDSAHNSMMTANYSLGGARHAGFDPAGITRYGPPSGAISQYSDYPYYVQSECAAFMSGFSGSDGKDFYRFDDGGEGIWTKLREHPIGGRFGTMTDYNRKIYRLGGLVNYSRVRTFFEYDIERDTWRRLADMPEVRMWYAMAASEGRIFVVGGSPFTDSGTAKTKPDFPCVLIYNMQSDTWSSDYTREGMGVTPPLGYLGW